LELVTFSLGADIDVFFLDHNRLQSIFQETESIGKSVQCHLPNMPSDLQACDLVIHAWAIGGGVSVSLFLLVLVLYLFDYKPQPTKFFSSFRADYH